MVGSKSGGSRDGDIGDGGGEGGDVGGGWGSGGGGGYVGLSHEYGYSWHMVE